MRTAFQRIFVKVDTGQPAFYGIGMPGFCIVRSTGQRNFCITELKVIRGAGFYQRQGLQWLDRRTRIDQGINLTPGVHQAPPGITNRNRAAMTILDDFSAQGLDQDRIAHFSVTRGRGSAFQSSRSNATRSVHASRRHNGPNFAQALQASSLILLNVAFIFDYPLASRPALNRYHGDTEYRQASTQRNLGCQRFIEEEYTTKHRGHGQ